MFDRLQAKLRNFRLSKPLKRLRRIEFSDFTVQNAKTVGLRIITVLARTSLPEILFITTFIISHFLTNADFSYPYELVLPIILLGILISIFFYVYRWIFGRVLTAHIAALPLAYYLYHYEDLSRHGHAVFGRLLADRLETPFTLGILYVLGAAVLFGALAYGVVKLSSLRPNLGLALTATKIALFIITFNFIVQAVVVSNFWIQARHQLAYQYKAPKLAKKSGAEVSKPNIYYLLYDRYTSAEVLQDVYKYDNSNFMNFLDEQEFVTRDTASSNYPYTMSSVGSTLAMNYLPELSQFAADNKQTGFPYRSILNNPPAVQALRENGYTYNLLSSWWDFARIGVRADSEPTKSFRLHLLGHDYFQSDFSRDIINRSALSPLVKKGVVLGNVKLVKYELDNNPVENFRSQVRALDQIATNTSGKSDKPQFTFAHFLMPHDPYIFNADGTETAYSHDRNDDGADEYVKYTNQVTYANTQIKKMIENIKASDPTAVIIMQTDEGPYPKQFRGSLTKTHYFDPKNLPVDAMRQKFGVLASYYLPGVDKAEVAANMTSNVNAFRYVLSHYLGYDLPLLPDCHISMGNKFDLYDYTLLNKQLTGVDAPECTKYVSQ